MILEYKKVIIMKLKRQKMKLKKKKIKNLKIELIMLNPTIALKK